MNRVVISCIIPTYRQTPFLFEAIDSVLGQNYSYIELIITDDGTIDFDANSILSYIKANKKENLVDYIVIHHENLGTVKNLNYAISQCSGEIIAVLASDDQLYSLDVFSKVVRRFNDSKCQLLTCSRMLYDEKMEAQIRVMPHQKYIRFINKHLNTPIKQFKFMALGSEMEFASGAAFYYTKDYFESVKGYDEKYTLWEDGPFIARAVRKGTTIEFAYDIIAVKYRDGGISSNKKRTNVQSVIQKDYENFYIWEFADYSSVLGKYLAYSARGLSQSFSANKNKTFALCVLFGKINLFFTKFIKFRLRYFP